MITASDARQLSEDAAAGAVELSLLLRICQLRIEDAALQGKTRTSYPLRALRMKISGEQHAEVMQLLRKAGYLVTNRIVAWVH
jgi:hypothetical protein